MARRKRRVQTQDNQSKQAVQPTQTADAFSNPLFHLGYGSQNPLEATEYPLTRLTDNYALLNSLYRTNWVVQNIVGIVPDDMVREWFKLVGTISPEWESAFNQVVKQTQLKDKICTGLKWGRLYGGAVGLIMIKGQEDALEEPLNLGAVFPGTFDGIYILDRWTGVAPDVGLVTDMSDPDYGLPAYYNISFPESGISARVHHSRIIRFIGRELPFLEKIAEVYWGESEVEAIYDDIVKHDNVAANIASLTFRANIDTMEVQNLDQLFSLASLEQQRRFWNTMQAQNVLKSNFGMQLVNKGDQIKNTQYTFTGLKDVYDTMCMELSGASRIPMTKLFGRSPSGMNATGESDLQNYYDYIDTLRESVLKPIIYKLLPILCMSAWGAVPDGIDITFPPLWTPTAKETAEIIKQKTETIINAFQAGLVDLDTAKKELKKLSQDTGMFDSITDDDIAKSRGKTFQDVTALRDPLMGLGYEEERPFETAVQDTAVMDYSPSQPRDKNGRWTEGGLTGSNENSKIDSKYKVIGKNGGTLKAEDLPEIKGSKGSYRAVPGTKVTGIYNFAGKGSSKQLRVEEHLIRQYGGQKGSWQHTAGNVMIDFGNGPQKTHIHWFQEPSVGIVGAKIKEED